MSSSKKTKTKNKNAQDTDFSSIEAYLDIIREGAGPELEELAGDIPAKQIPLVITYYYHTDNWDEKSAIVDILRFDEHADITAMMLDFLRAPKEFHDDDSKEYILMSKASALGFMSDEYDQIETYINDMDLLRSDIAKVLDENGLDFYPLDVTGLVKRAHKERAADAEEEAIYKQMPQEQLIYAMEHGRLDIAINALRNRADVNALVTEGDYKGMSMLMLSLSKAISHRKVDISNLVLDKGANVHVIRKIREKDDPTKGQTAIWWAANLGDIDIVQRLLDLGADPNITDQHGSNAFVEATSANNKRIAKLLSEAGTQTNVRMSDGRNAIQLACQHGHINVVKQLLDNGEDVNQTPSSNGFTLLMSAVSNNHVELSELLIARGADVNAIHSGGHAMDSTHAKGIYDAYRGYTPLVFAVIDGSVHLVEILTEAGADVNYVVPAKPERDLPARKISDFLGGKRSDDVILKLLEARGIPHAQALQKPVSEFYKFKRWIRALIKRLLGKST